MNLAVAAPPAWMALGACTNPAYDAEMWHPVGAKERPREPIEICGGCPVRAECAAYALARPTLEGIWGAMTHPERESVRRHRARPLTRGANSAASAGVRRR